MKEPVLVLMLLFLCKAGECKPALSVKYKLAVDITDSNTTDLSEQAKIRENGHQSDIKESRDTKIELKNITVNSSRQEPTTEQPKTLAKSNSPLMEITRLVKTVLEDHNLELERDLTTDNVSLKEEVNEWNKIGEDLTIEEEVSYYNQSGDQAQNISGISERAPPNNTTFSRENKCNSTTLGEYDQKYGYQEVYFENASGSPEYFLALLRAYFADVECNLVFINSSGPQSYIWANKSLETCKAIEKMRNSTQGNEFRIYFLPHFHITKVNFVLPKKCFPRHGDKIVVAASAFVIAGAIVLIAVVLVVIRRIRRKRAKMEESQHKHMLRNRLPILLPGEPITPNKEGRDNPAFVHTLPLYTSLKDLL